MKFLAVIPARYASSRFPGKPLALLGDKPIIQHVYERVSRVFDTVFVATDDERIADVVEAFNGRVVMTQGSHQSGTDRCFEAYNKVAKLLDCEFDVLVNVQGDEPFIVGSQLEAVKALFEDVNTDIATLIKPYPENTSWEELANPNTPKVVIDKDYFALYFSRSVIPYIRNLEKKEWASKHRFYKHIGLYAYRVPVLEKISSLPQGTLEIGESLEQLRWVESGFRIKTDATDIETIGIDTPDDLEAAKLFLKRMNDGVDC